MSERAPRSPVPGMWQAVRARQMDGKRGADVTGNWVGPTSEYPWEQDALDHIRSYMPDIDHYWAMQCFSFTSLGRLGRVYECDLFVASPSGLHLIEIKSHPGKAVNQGSTWIFSRGRPVPNPLALTDQKAKRLKALLFHQAERAGKRLPEVRVTASTFLSAPDLECAFTADQRPHLYGREGLERRTSLPSIWSDLIGARPEGRRLTPAEVHTIASLLRPVAMGIPSRELRLGSFLLERRPIEEGPTWQDHLAEHTDLADEPPKRVRIYTAAAETDERHQSLIRAAKREHLAVKGIRHRGIVDTEYFSGEDLDLGPAIVFQHGEDWKRLDHYLRDEHAGLDLDTRVYMIRQLTDALAHAHGRRLFHRSLSARSVWVEPGRYPRLRIADWQTASTPALPTGGDNPTRMSGLAAHLIEPAVGPYLAPEWADPNPLKSQQDVFGLGAVAYTIITGTAPAPGIDELEARLHEEKHLDLQSRFDDIPDQLNDLIARATRCEAVERHASVQEFAADLDAVEAALATAGDPDPLHARKGEAFGEYKVKRVLGTGSTGRALLVERAGRESVLKIALPDDGERSPTPAERLASEAESLRKCRSSHIIKAESDLVDLPHGRKGLLLQYAGVSTLADRLEREGPLSLDELMRYSDHLFAILHDLERASLWHRDLKPENLGLRRYNPSKPPELALFDFSHAGLPDDNLKAGTRGYIDPFLGTGGRDHYDEAAEHYAAAVTLYAMATAEPFDWGETGPEGPLVPGLAADRFDPAIKTGLTEFFKRAFHRDAAARHQSLYEMRLAFQTALQPKTPPTPQPRYSSGIDHHTPLRLTDLDARLASIAETKLATATVGELIDLAPSRIDKAPGIGSKARGRLREKRREWAAQLAEELPPLPQAAQAGDAETDATLTVDRIADGLIALQHRDPQYIHTMRLLFGLDETQRDGSCPRWLTEADIAARVGIDTETVVDYIETGHRRLTGGHVKGLTSLREDLLSILEHRGRVMPLDALASALLAARGAEAEDEPSRFAAAAACVRAVLLVQSRILKPLVHIVTGLQGTWLAALGSRQADQPTEEELQDWAVQLGEAAGRFATDVKSGQPLPSAEEARDRLRGIEPFEPLPRLDDRDLFALAAGATTGVGVTPRFELYPIDLDPARAVRIVGLTTRLRNNWTPVSVLVEQIERRFPDLEWLRGNVRSSELTRVLETIGIEVVRSDDGRTLRLADQSSTGQHLSSTAEGEGPPASRIETRLQTAAERGGFLAVKATLKTASAATDKLSRLPGVTSIDVADCFMAALRAEREAMAARTDGLPTWDTVIEADAPDADPTDRNGLRRLSEPAWRVIEARVQEAEGIVLLHNATPLARFDDGRALLQTLIAGARRHTGPFALWLVCPMTDYRKDAALDGYIVGALDVDGEQLDLTSEYVRAS